MFARAESGIPALDGLRAIAVLLVLGRHAVRPFRGDEPGLLQLGPWDASTLFTNGWIGVDLFFVLSGFLIAHQFLRVHDGVGRVSLADYALRRAFRIVPAYLAVIGLVVLGAFPGYQPGASAFEVGRHFLFMQDYGGSHLVAAFWSLGVEVKFYLLAPALLLILARAQGPRPQAALLAALFLLPLVARGATYAAHPPAGYEEAFFALRAPFHLSTDGFVIGILIALVLRASQLGQVRISRALAGLSLGAGVALVAALAVIVPLSDRPTWLGCVLLPSVLALGFGLVTFACVFLPHAATRALSGRSLFAIGRLSYPLYLVHMPLVPVSLFAVRGMTGPLGVPEGVTFIVFVPVFVALSSVAALALHALVEVPLVPVRNRLLARVRQHAPRTPAEGALVERPA